MDIIRFGSFGNPLSEQVGTVTRSMNRVQCYDAQNGKYSPDIVVLGACFLDYIAYVDHVPRIGETMHSQDFQKGFGGKGANQAVAAGRLGAKTAMVGIVGGDGDGADYLKQLQSSGVDTTHLYRDMNSSSGLAMIFVDATTSNNEIVICPNVTHRLTRDFLRARTNNYATVFAQSVKYAVFQNEIPLETTLDVLKEAHQRGVYTVFNAAPAPSPQQVPLITPYLPYVSLFCPNEIEAQLITGVAVTDTASAFDAIKVLQRLGVKDVVITLGAAGFALAEKGSLPVHHPGKRVAAVDTTGAGDCFVGTMAYFLSQGHSLLEACKRANECAAVSVTRKGTQSSYPTSSELPPGVM